MHESQRTRTHELLKSRGLRRALFAEPASVTWLTGYAPPVQTGPSPFSGGPVLVGYADGEFTLFTMDGQGPAREEGLTVQGYAGYTLDPGFAGPDSLAAAVSAFESRSNGGPTGLEIASLPARLANLFADSQPVAIDGWLAPLRMIKTPAELARLRSAFDLAVTGHAAARAAIRPGMREIDLWAAIRSAVDTSAGRRVPLGNDCVVNTRSNNIGGWPEEKEIRPGDSVIIDIGVRVDGYWSDSCATYYAGPVSSRAAAAHRTVEEALAYAAGLLRPGAVTGEIDRKVRSFIAREGYAVYPHHTGHGVGVAPHELPRIVPENPLALAPGMVVMLEPGIYVPGEIAVRLEDAFLITEDGSQVLTDHRKEI